MTVRIVRFYALAVIVIARHQRVVTCSDLWQQGRDRCLIGRNKYVRTEGFVKEQQAGRMLFKGDVSLLSSCAADAAEVMWSALSACESMSQDERAQNTKYLYTA